MKNLLLLNFLSRNLRPAIGLAVLFISSFSLQGQTCIGSVNVSLEDDCERVMSAASFGAATGSSVIIEVNNVVRADSTLTIADLGQNIIYMLSVPGFEACWGEINLENKLDPVLTCPAAAEIGCSQSSVILTTATDLNPLLNAKASDCYGDLTVTSFDQVKNLDCQDNALAFDGTDDVVTLDGFANLSESFTFEAWVNPIAKTNYSTIISTKIAGSSAPGFFFSINDFGTSTGELVFGTTANKVVSTPFLSFGTWQHVAVSYDGTTVTMFVDGVAVATTGSVDLQPGASTTALIGGGVSGSNNYKFVGSMDDLRIWSTARTSTEIATNYDKTLDGSETGLSNYYTFDQGISGDDNSSPSISELEDKAGTLNGTLSNFDLTGTTSNWVQNRLLSDEFSQIITRTFVTVGTNGKSASCTQEIKIQRADIDDITMPSDYSASCSTSTSTDPTVTGYPTYDPDGTGVIAAIDLIPGETGGACMLISSYSDSVIPKCGPEQLINRTWQVINMCQAGGTANQFVTFNQIISITTPDPTIDAIAAITIGADSGVADSHGGCYSTASLPTATVSGLCTGQVVAADDIVISISGLGQTTNGGTVPSPGLSIGGPYTITYTATDSCGNIGTLDVEVTVVDNTAPQCNSQDVNITLGTDGTSTVGYATFNVNSSDNCSGTVWVSVRRLNGLCTTGVEDDFGETVDFCCDDVPSGTQDTIMVQQLTCDKDPALASNYSTGVVALETDGSPSSTFTGNCSRCMASVTVKVNSAPSLTCPSDSTVTCANYSATTSYGAPTIVSAACTITGLTQTFTDSGTVSCSGGTITRTHNLLNGTTVLATCTQTITITGGITITAPEDVTSIDCADYSCDNLPPGSISGEPTVTGTSCSSTTILFDVVETNCTEVNGTLTFTRTWTVIPASDPDGCFTDQEFSHVVSTLANCCLDPDIRISSPTNGTSVGLTFFDSNDDPALYTWDWFNGTRDDIGVSFDSGVDALEISGLMADTPYVLIFNQINNPACADTTAASTPSDASRIIGLVSTEFGTPIQNVSVALESNQAARVIGKDDVMSEVMTDEVGLFEFDEVDLPSLNRLTLTKDGDDRDNISTRDLLIMSRHILGIKEISSPYSYIAADLTGNGKISTGDMLLMQKIVLGITYDMPNNSSWRFVREDHVFDDMNTILDYEFPEYFTFTGEETEDELSDLNFIAVKVGDLAGAYGAELQGGNSTTKTLSLQTDNQRLLPGAIIEVPIRAGDAQNLSGYQHAYQFDADKVVFTGIDFGTELGLGDNNFGYQHLGDGYLTTSWFDTEDKNIEAGTVIYKLRFEVKEAAQLKDVLSISSEHTQAEAYFDGDKLGTVQFAFSESIGDQLIVVNSPNPFKESTQIRFEAPSKGDAVIRVTDISGREVYRSELVAVRGENQLTINKSDLQEAGIYILKIDLNGSSATQKIVMIE